ncbi:MAG: hemolysin III family protein [Oscillospiraceae bacterium]|nr:hemolysin III family protein [Oscillospiraceae bacterium]
MYSEQALPRVLSSTQRKPRHKLKGEQGRDPYDGLRPWSAVTHGVGILLAVVGTFFLMLRSVYLASTWHAAAYFVYGATMFALYTASTLYHCLNVSVKGRMLLRKLDHTSIYLLIAGTYTPICLTALRGPWGWSLFGVIWGLAAAGIVLAFAWIMAPRWLTAGIYLFMGWLALAAIYPLTQVLTPAGMFWLVLGGVLYTIGGVLYGLKWPGRDNPRFGCHEIFHVFILLGSIAHYVLMFQI